tara:strand:- start:1651 stop:2532 length:882 start_codon:yes stop_codon:yes gene_type:complete
MKKDQVVILENRGTILISGVDARDFLQNIITNDINKVSDHNSIFSALLTPQGKYFFEFFIIKSKDGFLLDCSEGSTSELIENLSKYKLRSRVKIEDVSSNFVVGTISVENFKDLIDKKELNGNTIYYRDTPIFLDPRNNQLGARIISNLDKLYLTIKKLSLKIIDSKEYFFQAYKLGIPEKGIKGLKDQLFGLEANYENLQAIDFKKGCFIGQENTARMRLKNKLRRKLMAISSSERLNVGEELTYKNYKVGKIMIDKPYAFALIKMFDPSFKEFENKELTINNKKCKILKSI